MIAIVIFVISFMIVSALSKGKLSLKFVFLLTVVLGEIIWGIYKNMGGPAKNSTYDTENIVTDEKLTPGYEYLRMEDGSYVMSEFKRMDAAESQIGDTVSVKDQGFSFCVDSAELLRVYNGYLPRDGMIFLIADLTVIEEQHNSFDSWSFSVRWGENYDEEGLWIYDGEAHPQGYHGVRGSNIISAEIRYEQNGEMPNTVYQTDENTAYGYRSFSALGVFEVPILEGTNRYSLCYLVNPKYSDDDYFIRVFSTRFDLTTPEEFNTIPSGNLVSNRYTGGDHNKYINKEFSYRIDFAKLCESEDPIDGNNYFVDVKMTVKNESNHSIDLSPSDFQLHWGYHYKGYSYPLVQNIPGLLQMREGTWTIDAGTSAAANFIYPVPIFNGANEYRIECPDFDGFRMEDDLQGSFNLIPSELENDMLTYDRLVMGSYFVLGGDGTGITKEEAQAFLEEYIMELSGNEEMPFVEYNETLERDDGKIFHVFWSDFFDMGNGDRIAVDTQSQELYVFHADDGTNFPNTYIPLIDWVRDVFLPIKIDENKPSSYLNEIIDAMESSYYSDKLSLMDARHLLEDFIKDIPNAPSEIPPLEYKGLYMFENQACYMFYSELLDLGNGDRIIVGSENGKLYAAHANDGTDLSNVCIPLEDWVSGYFFTMVDPWTGERLIIG